MRPLVPLALLALASPHLLAGATLYFGPRLARNLAGQVAFQSFPGSSATWLTLAMGVLAIAFAAALFQRRRVGWVVVPTSALLAIGFVLWGAKSAWDIAHVEFEHVGPEMNDYLIVSLLLTSGTHAAIAGVVGMAALRARILTTVAALAVPVAGAVGLWARVQANQAFWGFSWVLNDPVSVWILIYQATAWMALLALLIAVWAGEPTDDQSSEL